jgi:hypothetical protein
MLKPLEHGTIAWATEDSSRLGGQPVKGRHGDNAIRRTADISRFAEYGCFDWVSSECPLLEDSSRAGGTWDQKHRRISPAFDRQILKQEWTVRFIPINLQFDRDEPRSVEAKARELC